MIYKDFKGIKLSALGLGNMRLPVINGDDSRINEAEAEKMVDYAIENGINYFDTAWGYHGENSELFLGKALNGYSRDEFYIATKFPGYDLRNMPKVEEIFEKQLEKCQVEYFDFYLLHNVCEMNIDAYLDEKYGIVDYLCKQKQSGRIKHLGFSAHAGLKVLERFLETYGECMEFCQLQLNYLDWIFQYGKQKTEMLSKYGIPVWVMEPLRGGNLAKLSPEQEEKLRALRPDETIPAWAFRFLQSIPGVTMILSGMSSMQQLKENIETFREDKPLDSKEMETLLGIGKEMISAKTLPCTGCHYCVSHCPQGLDIPSLLALYNEHIITGGGFIAPMALAAFDKDKRPDSCIGCRSCESVCPQNLEISEAMKDFMRKL